jgi:hypothetical protein
MGDTSGHQWSVAAAAGTAGTCLYMATSVGDAASRSSHSGEEMAAVQPGWGHSTGCALPLMIVHTWLRRHSRQKRCRQCPAAG